MTKFFSWTKKSKKYKSKDAEKLFDEVLGQVAPQLQNSVDSLIDNERKQLIKKAIENMQQQLKNIANEPTAPVQQSSQVQSSQVQSSHVQPLVQVQSNTVKPNAPYTVINTTSANPEILQNVIQQLIPYLEESVKTMITNERDLLIGTIVQHIQNNLNEKNQIKSE
jgi:F0F1-type ATP synthase delta subunit